MRAKLKPSKQNYQWAHQLPQQSLSSINQLNTHDYLCEDPQQIERQNEEDNEAEYQQEEEEEHDQEYQQQDQQQQEDQQQFYEQQQQYYEQQQQYQDPQQQQNYQDEEENQQNYQDEQENQQQEQSQKLDQNIEYEIIRKYWEQKYSIGKVKSSNQSFNLKINNDQYQHLTKYRPDIDGLRGIAIAYVVIFHAWPQLLPGGFIGVDIFFVISGYLITGIILKQQLQNQFSFTNFYARRVKRIFPVLIFVMVAVLLIGCNRLMARPIQLLTKTLFASTLFASNLQIMTYEQDYFDPDIKTNPYLHLWSLGVEEQFYMIWPLVITMIIYCLNKQKGTLFFVFFILTSFWMNIKYHKINSKMAFYFPFCRFWEMSIGSFAAYIGYKFKDNQICDIISIFSFVILFISGLLISQNVFYPGYWALVPTLCSMLLIMAERSLLNKYILASTPLVLLGKISYSLYLWHWPLLVFSRIFYPRGSTSILVYPFIIILIAGCLSLLTYLYIQNKLRFKKQKKIALILVILMFAVGMYALHVNSHIRSISAAEKGLASLSQKQNQAFYENYKVNYNDYSFKNKQSRQNSRANVLQHNQGNYQLKTYDSSLTRKNNANRNVNSNQKSRIARENRQKNAEIYITNLQQQNNNANKNNIPANNQQKFSNTVPQAQKPAAQIPINQVAIVPHALQKYNQAVMPKKQDFYQKNGRKTPNSSKNKKRQPATLQKIRFSGSIDPDGGLGKLYLQKRVAPGSPYFVQGAQVFHYFQLANQGKQNQIFIIGDSHAQNINYRFMQLYQQSKSLGKTDQFPTVITMVDRNQPFFPCRTFYHVVMKYIKLRKPKRVFFMHRWLKYFNFGIKHNKPFYQQLNSPCNQGKRYSDKTQTDFLRLLQVYVDAMKQIQNYGVEVYVAAIDPEDIQFDPHLMLDANGLIENNIKPVKMSYFRSREPNKYIIDNFEKELKNAGVNLVYLSDNYCWEDVCQVTMPSGYSTFKDGTHFSSAFIKYWATAVDFLTEF